MIKFIWLLFAHYIGDTALQGDWTSQNKTKYWYVMLCHCMVWTACVSIALEYIGLFSIWKVWFLIGGHGLMDYTKRRYSKGDMDMKWIYIDQAFHILQLGVVCR